MSLTRRHARKDTVGEMAAALGTTGSHIRAALKRLGLEPIEEPHIFRKETRKVAVP